MTRTLIGLALLLLSGGFALADDELTAAQELLKRGDRTFNTRAYAKATEIYKQALAVAEKAGETETMVEALSMAARGHLIRKEKDAGRPFIERAGKLAKDTMPRGWSRYLGVLGRFHWKDGDKPKATKVFEQMYAFCMRHDLHNRAVDAAHMVAITGTKEQQLAWARKGIAAAEAGKLDGWLGPLWNNLGITFHDMGDDEKALEAYTQARHYHWKVGGEKSKLVADWAVGMTLRKLGRYKEARTWLRPVLAWAERRHAEHQKPETNEWVGLALLELGIIAKKLGDPAQGRRDLERARPILAGLKMSEWHPELWKDLTDALPPAPKLKDRSVLLQLARMQISTLGHGVRAFQLRRKRLPRSLRYLDEAALSGPGQGPPPKPRDTTDPWGNELEYRTCGRRFFEIRSYGPDGKRDTADDITYTNDR